MCVQKGEIFMKTNNAAMQKIYRKLTGECLPMALVLLALAIK